MADEIKSLAEMKLEARAGLAASLAESVSSDSAATTDRESGSSPEANGAKPSEGTSSESDKPEDKTSTSSGSAEDLDAYWNQYKDEEARKKAFKETKEYAADLARQLREAKAGKPQETESKTEEKGKESVEQPASKSSSEVKKVDDLSVDDWINESLNLKEGHTEDQLKIAQVNFEVLKFHKEVFLPSIESEKTTRESLEKANEAVRDQKVVVARFKKMAEGNSVYVDDLKEAESELRQLEKAHTDARLDWREAKDKLEDAKAEERSKRAEGRAFAHEAVERLKQKSRESKAQIERAESEKKVREESNKIWKSEFEKALKANGLEDASEKAKALLHDAAYNHVGRLAKAGQITEDADLQPLFKDAFSPYLELKSGVPASVEKVERKRDLTEEPGPSERKAKSGEEKPQTLAEMKAAARRGLKSSLSK